MTFQGPPIKSQVANFQSSWNFTVSSQITGPSFKSLLGDFQSEQDKVDIQTASFQSEARKVELHVPIFKFSPEFQAQSSAWIYFEDSSLKFQASSLKLDPIRAQFQV